MRGLLLLLLVVLASCALTANAMTLRNHCRHAIDSLTKRWCNQRNQAHDTHPGVELNRVDHQFDRDAPRHGSGYYHTDDGLKPIIERYFGEPEEKKSERVAPPETKTRTRRVRFYTHRPDEEYMRTMTMRLDQIRKNQKSNRGDE